MEDNHNDNDRRRPDERDATQSGEIGGRRGRRPRLAIEDDGFLQRDDVRSIRLQLEYLKPELILSEQGIRSTVVVFGSARVPAPGAEVCASNDQIAARLRAKSKDYELARALARLVSEKSLALGGDEFVIVSGGGPGFMEAANRGAGEVGARSIGLNIQLPQEQDPNPYITPELSFEFHYFAIRKMLFLRHAKAIICFPGGYGTMDELFEVLTLIQTGKTTAMPIILFDEQHWRRVVDVNILAEEGFISPEDLDLFQYVSTPEQAWEIIAEYYKLSI